MMFSVFDLSSQTCLNLLSASLAIACLGLRTTKADSRPPAQLPFTADAQIIDIGDNLPHTDCYFDCKTNGLNLTAPHQLIARMKRGDLVTLSAKPRSNGSPLLLSIDRHGTAPLATPVPCTLQELAARHARPSAVRGVLQSAAKDETDALWNWMTLQTPEGKLPVTARESEFPLDELRGMVDAEVLLSGYPKSLNTWREGLGQCLVLMRDLPQEITRPAPQDPHRIPEWNGRPSPHRQRIEGTVLALGLGRMYVKSEPRKFCEIRLPTVPVGVRQGDAVAVAGFVENTPDGILMKEAILEKTTSFATTVDAIEDLTFDLLFPAKSGKGTVSRQYYHKVIRIVGKILAYADRPDGQRVLLLGNGRHTMEVDLSTLPDECHADIGVGCTLRVTGLCLADVDYNQASPANLHFRTFSILPRSAADIEILDRPPWWTPARMLVVIGFLTVVLTAILLWNRALTILSQRRGRSLFKEQIARATAELRTFERTRLAVELHDTIAQNLTGASFEIQTAFRLAAVSPEKTRKHLEIVDRTLKSCRDDIRNCIWDLRANSLGQEDLNQAISVALSPHVGSASLQVRFNVPRARLSEPTLHALLRIVRELAINAVRHGRATEVKVAGSIEEHALLFSVRDNGCGFDPERVPDAAHGHFGLQGIRERLRKLDGSMTINSSAEHGTRVAVRLDLHDSTTAQQP